MVWSTLAELDLENGWNHSPPSEDNVFRISYSNEFNISFLILAQSEVGESTQLFDLQRLAVREEMEILHIPKPTFFENRRIAFKAVALSDSKPATLSIRLESQYMSLVNPVSLSIPDNTVGTTTATTVTVEGAVDELLAAKPTRRGFTLWNAGNVAVNVAVGFSATASSFSFRLLPGGFYEGPTNYTGTVSAIAPSGSASILVTEVG